MTIDRRAFIVTSAAAVAAAPSTPALAQSGDAAARKTKIDAMLRTAADAGDVPGVVAMATDRNGTIYEGAFGKRVLGQPAAHDGGHRRVDRLDDQGGHGSRGHAAGGAGQARSRRARRQNRSRHRQGGSAGGLRRRRAAPHAQAQARRSRCATCSPTRPASATTSGTPISPSTWRRRTSPASSPARTWR